MASLLPAPGQPSYCFNIITIIFNTVPLSPLIHSYSLPVEVLSFIFHTVAQSRCSFLSQASITPPSM